MAVWMCFDFGELRNVMALLDDLISQIPDLSLRERLQKAVINLRRKQKFGLVFEEHIPETTAIFGLPIAVGSLVQRRQESEENLPLRVIRLVHGGKSAVLAAQDGREETVAIGDLLTVKRFGEPMYATMKSIDRIQLGGNMKPYHAVVNGENFHALQLFTYIYEKAVDCIYIDPPYNTGARDWKYNNRFVDSNDAWRHSKWLAMMEKRLRLAKRLLKPDGVLIVMIDEHELHHLGMLLERLFPEYRQRVVSIVVNARGSTGDRNFGSIDEQAIFVVPNLDYDVIQPREAFVPNFRPSEQTPTSVERLLAKITKALPDLPEQMKAAGAALNEEELDEWQDIASSILTLWDDDDFDDQTSETPDASDIPVETDPAVYWRGAVRTGQGTSFRTQRKNQFYPLYIDPKKPKKIKVGKSLIERDENGDLRAPSWEPVDGLTPIWPIDEEGAERVWCYEPGRMELEIAKGNIRIGRFNPKRNTYAVNVRRVRRTKQRFRERTIWWEQSYDAGSNGTNILKKLLGSSGLFPFPKSIYAVRDVLATIVGSRPNALIVDFFAGSGTTLHSTFLLNEIDGGSRRCILVTNNEVDEKTSADLMKAGYYRGDPQFESMGIFKRVTDPRIKAAVTGKRPNGAPLTGKYKWALNKPLSAGFKENVEFFDLQYLDPDDVDLGDQFKSIHPLLWLASEGIGEREEVSANGDFYIAPASPYAVLFKPSRLKRFLAAIQSRPDVTHVWVVTDSEGAYAETCEALPRHVIYKSQLYRDYLRTFRVNGRSY
jgi:adenine-specific DNA-methyltransferase